MTTEKIKSTSEVLNDFLDAQSENDELDAGTVSAIRDLRSEGNLTKTSLLRRLEDARKDGLNQVKAKFNSDDD